MSSGLCVYCGVQEATSTDHVPPKNIFPKPRPSDLITVPACDECHGGTSKDDEYFRDRIVMRYDVGGHPQGERILEKVRRALKRREQQAYVDGLLKSSTLVDLQSEAGLYLGSKPAYHVDLTRLNRVASRILRGLYFHEYSTPLPAAGKAEAWALDGLDVEKREAVAAAWNHIRLCAEGEERRIGSGVFTYWFRSASDEPTSAAWLLLFFERVLFLGVTAPMSKEEIEARLE